MRGTEAACEASLRCVGLPPPLGCGECIQLLVFTQHVNWGALPPNLQESEPRIILFIARYLRTLRTGDSILAGSFCKSPLTSSTRLSPNGSILLFGLLFFILCYCLAVMNHRASRDDHFLRPSRATQEARACCAAQDTENTSSALASTLPCRTRNNARPGTRHWRRSRTRGASS